MRKTNVNAILENGQFIVLPEKRNLIAPPPPQPRQPACTVTPLSRHAATACATPDPGPVSEEFYLAPQGNPGGQVVVYGGGYDFSNVNLFGQYGGGGLCPIPPSGPTYIIPNPGSNCVGETLTAMASLATSISVYIKSNASKFGSDVMEYTGWLDAGEITASEYIGALITMMLSADFLALLGAVGATAGAVYLLYKCTHG